MAAQPLFSIVTASYNQAAFLQAAMDSVLTQDYPNIEYIVIDGGSNDESPAIIKRQQRKLAFWVSERDRGQADAINKGFAKAKGKYMAWLNADDRFKPGAVREAVEFLESHPDVGLVYGDTEFIDAQGRVVGRFAARQTDYSRLLQGYVHIPQQATFWRSALWWQAGPLDENLSFAMDYDFWVRLSKISKLQYHPRLWAEFRLHADSKTIQNDMRAWDDMLTVHRRQGGSPFSIITAKYWLRKLLFPIIRYRRQRMAGVRD